MATISLKRGISSSPGDEMNHLSPGASLGGLVIMKEITGVTFHDTKELTFKFAHCNPLDVFGVVIKRGRLYPHLLEQMKVSVGAVS